MESIFCEECGKFVAVDEVVSHIEDVGNVAAEPELTDEIDAAALGRAIQEEA